MKERFTDSEIKTRTSLAEAGRGCYAAYYNMFEVKYKNGLENMKLNSLPAWYKRVCVK